MAAEPKKKPTLEKLQEEIRLKAGELFKKRVADKKPGDELSDWLQAEKEIKKKYGI